MAHSSWISDILDILDAQNWFGAQYSVGHNNMFKKNSSIIAMRYLPLL
jgi:hypothetical protein